MESAAKATPATYHPLIEDAALLEAAWYRRTGVYPTGGVLVVKDERLAKLPWLARSLSTAFTEAKNRYLARLRSGEANGENDIRYRELTSLIGPDPLPYGINPNLPTIEMLITYAVQQELMPRRMSVERAFRRP